MFLRSIPFHLFLVLTYLTVACGIKNDQGTPFRSIPTEGLSAHSYIFDPVCQNLQSEIVLTKLFGYGISSPPTTAQQYILRKGKTSKSFSTSLVSNTTFKTRWQRICSNKTCLDTDGTALPYGLVDKEPVLRVCKNNFIYPRDSYEGIAISTLYFLDRAYQNHQEWTKNSGDRGQISQLHLSIFPEFESLELMPLNRTKQSIETYSSTWRMDNLAYFSRSQTIAVYPTQFSAQSPKQLLWESAFVVSHEFAHHVEKNLASNFEELKRGWTENSNHWKYSGIPTGKNSELRTRTRLINSFSEGFADLLAFYSVSQSTDSLESFGTDRIDRIASSPVFADLTSKILTTRTLKSFFSTTSSGKDEQPNQSPLNSFNINKYRVGGIFAHQANQAFNIVSHATKGNGPLQQNNTAIKYRLAIAWMKKFYGSNNFWNKAASPESAIAWVAQSLHETTWDFLKTTNNSESTQGVMTDVCKALKAGFPGISTPCSSHTH